MIANFISWKAHQRGDPKRWEKTFPSKAPSPTSAETEVDADELYIPVLDIFCLSIFPAAPPSLTRLHQLWKSAA
jgi:hypothetical protein